MPTLVTLATYEQSKTACFLKEKFEKLFKPNLFKKILQESNLPILLFPS
jgi:hypothetical protein